MHWYEPHRAKHLAHITLSHTVSKFNTFVCLSRILLWLPNMAGDQFSPNNGQIPLNIPYSAEITLFCTNYFFFAFYAEIQVGHKKWLENSFFGQDGQMPLHILFGPKFWPKVLYLASFQIYYTKIQNVHQK